MGLLAGVAFDFAFDMGNLHTLTPFTHLVVD